MNPGTTASLICPACGQAFLTMQQSMAGMAQCPHCAHSGSRAQFGTQAQVAGVAQVRRRVSQTQPLSDMTAPIFQPPPASQPAAWPGLQPKPEQAPAASFARMTLQPSQALMPTGAPAPAAEFTSPSQLRTSSWKHAFILLAFLVVCAAAIWLWWDHANAPAFAPETAAASPPEVAEVRKAQIATKTETTVALLPPPDVAAIAADTKALVAELFAADTPERRAACFHDAEKYRTEIAALFGATAAEKIELQLLARIPGMPLTLPGGQPTPLFKLTTSKCPTGALIRLETGADGKRRIHWPLFLETHEGKLAALIKNNDSEAAWMHVGLRPSHGLDIPAELRAKYLTFDVQVSAGSDPHFVACLERDTPLGRFLDRETEWGKAYLARLLVRKLDIQADAPCVMVLDCEGAQEK